MTTLILDNSNKILYADTQETHNKSLIYKCSKLSLLKIQNKGIGILAESGDSAEIETFKHYVNTLKNLEQLKEVSDKRPNWKHLGGIIGLFNGNTFFLEGDGTPCPITDTYMTDGAGKEIAYALLKNNIDISSIYLTLGEITTHTSKDYYSVSFLKKPTFIEYHANENSKKETKK